MTRVRKFRIEDAVEVARLHRSTIRSVNKDDYTPAQIAAWSGNATATKQRKPIGEGDRFVALKGDKIVGFSEYRYDGRITAVYVHKDFQRQGIAAKLLTHLEKQARKRGLKELRLKSTLTAQPFYKKHGYKSVKRMLYESGNEKLPVMLMRKKL